MIAAIDRILGSHSFLAHTSSLLILQGKGPSWNANRKSLVRMIFSRFKPISLRITSGTEAGFLVSGQKDGLVVDSGVSYTRIIPIIELTPLPFAAAMLPIGGEDVTRALVRNCFLMMIYIFHPCIIIRLPNSIIFCFSIIYAMTI